MLNFFPPSLSSLPFFLSSRLQVNEDLDHRTLLRKYERELRRLRAELQQKSKDLVDKRLVLQVGAGAVVLLVVAGAAVLQGGERCGGAVVLTAYRFTAWSSLILSAWPGLLTAPPSPPV